MSTQQPQKGISVNFKNTIKPFAFPPEKRREIVLMIKALIDDDFNPRKDAGRKLKGLELISAIKESNIKTGGLIVKPLRELKNLNLKISAKKGYIYFYRKIGSVMLPWARLSIGDENGYDCTIEVVYVDEHGKNKSVTVEGSLPHCLMGANAEAVSEPVPSLRKAKADPN